MPDDPYTEAATGVLRNKLGLSTAALLEAAEREITHAALILLRESPVRPTYDLSHLRAIHGKIFADIYDWAGQLRTVAIGKGTLFCLPQPSCAAMPSRCGTCSKNSLAGGDELGQRLLPLEYRRSCPLGIEHPAPPA